MAILVLVPDLETVPLSEMVTRAACISMKRFVQSIENVIAFVGPCDVSAVLQMFLKFEQM